MAEERDNVLPDTGDEVVDKSENNEDSGREIKKEGHEEITLVIQNRTPSQAFFLDLSKQCGKTLKDIRASMALQGLTLPKSFKFVTLSDNLLTLQAEGSVLLSEVLRRKPGVKDNLKLDHQNFEGFDDKTDDQDGSSARDNQVKRSGYEVKIFPLKTKKKNKNKQRQGSSAMPDQESPLVDQSTISLLSADQDAEDDQGQGQTEGQGQIEAGEVTAGRPCPLSAFNKFVFGNCPLTRQPRCPLTKIIVAMVLALPIALFLTACTAYSLHCLLGPTTEGFLPGLPGLVSRSELTDLEQRLESLEAGQHEAQAQMVQALGAMTTLTRELHATLHADVVKDGPKKTQLLMDPWELAAGKKNEKVPVKIHGT